jgi:hypothetical protein
MTSKTLPIRAFLASLPLACAVPGDSESTSSDVGTATSGAQSTGASSQGSESGSSEGSTSAGESSDDGADAATASSDDGDDSSTDGGSASSAESGAESDPACDDVQSDPMNCGACGSICDAPSFGEPICSGATCSVECQAGYDEVDVDGATRCSKFAGFFLLRENGTCEAANPFTEDCSCPSGFDDRPVSSWRVSPGDGSSWVQLAVCSPVAEDATDAWGGLFAEYEDGGACAFPNPFHIPLCLCPDGYSVTSQWRGANINGEAIRISFCSAGAFEDDALFVGGFTADGGGGCATSNCACPDGSTRVDYPTVFGGVATTSSFCYRE